MNRTWSVVWKFNKCPTKRKSLSLEQFTRITNWSINFYCYREEGDEGSFPKKTSTQFCINIFYRLREMSPTLRHLFFYVSNVNTFFPASYQFPSTQSGSMWHMDGYLSIYLPSTTTTRTYLIGKKFGFFSLSFSATFTSALHEAQQHQKVIHGDTFSGGQRFRIRAKFIKVLESERNETWFFFQNCSTLVCVFHLLSIYLPNYRRYGVRLSARRYLVSISI